MNRTDEFKQKYLPNPLSLANLDSPDKLTQIPTSPDPEHFSKDELKNILSEANDYLSLAQKYMKERNSKKQKTQNKS